MLSLCASASAPEDAVTARALVTSLGRPAPARTPFAEARFLKVLDQPLVVSGELAWLGDDRLERQVEHPNRELSTIANGEVTQQREGRDPRRFSLKRAPQLQILLDSFVALLGGDSSRLEQAFTVQHTGDDARGWTLTLTPRDPKLAHSVSRIEIQGRGNEPRCMRMQEADGDLAVDLLGELASKMPAVPTREALAALCQGG
ncbi:outer membrane lipoprotein carrier protein LolA [Dyella soli]|uniref:Outer membrane lipoprotein carrier protein LolA n=2 Tax=Dyella soli TaxID=522319 RepID=A0A4R0YRH8_9GAMM|nr:outer membrane lipoprotein carrier protein LolA [Dyella soli]